MIVQQMQMREAQRSAQRALDELADRVLMAFVLRKRERHALLGELRTLLRARREAQAAEPAA